MAVPSDPAKPSVPLSYPITDLETLLLRSYFDSFHYPFNVSSVPLPSSAVEMPRRRRILICHDFKGGYTNEDRWVQGGASACSYAIWHWHLIDVFVYFSHYLVTLPPPGWTNAAHTHGVKVLGTFITEWEKGREMCNTLLSTAESARTCAERLAELANKLGFDGWLINMEVKLDPQQIANMKEFVGHLTRTMHNVVSGSLVIWYDSVTVDGDLKYQDQLNEKNKPFFDLCDGIYCNYSWKEDYPKNSRSVAGNRRFDVYMGIDVWGRGTYGGGQWNTNIALDVLKEDDVSAAIFGPGWVYETQQGPDFQTAQNRWWCLLEQSWEVLQNYPKVLPFYSNFNQGHGFHYSIGGSQVIDSPWNNISCQGFQPVLDWIESSRSSMQVYINFEDASYGGGGSITCRGSLNSFDMFSTRLFLGQLVAEHPVSLTYYVKSDGNSQMGLKLSFCSNSNRKMHILFSPDGVLPAEQLTNEDNCIILAQRSSRISSGIISRVKCSRMDLSLDSDWVQYESSFMMSGYILTEIRLVCYLKNTDAVNASFRNITTTPNADGPPYDASLGLICIQISDQNTEFPSADSWITEGESISWSLNNEGTRTVSLKIAWKLKTRSAQSFTAYHIYIQKLTAANLDYSTVTTAAFLGITRAGVFYVSGYEIPSGVTSLKFIIQVCAVDGTFQELDKSPIYQLAIEGP